MYLRDWIGARKQTLSGLYTLAYIILLLINYRLLVHLIWEEKRKLKQYLKI